MSAILMLNGWDVAVVFLLGSLAGACLMEAARIGAELMRRRRRSAARKEAWRL